jgi:hypothetical protein
VLKLASALAAFLNTSKKSSGLQAPSAQAGHLVACGGQRHGDRPAAEAPVQKIRMTSLRGSIRASERLSVQLAYFDSSISAFFGRSLFGRAGKWLVNK